MDSKFYVSAATEFLQEPCYIHGESESQGYGITQHVDLNCQQIFDALVSLYADFFQIYWSEFGSCSSVVDIAAGLSPQKHLALVYISNWFLDLHAINAKIVRNLIGCLASEIPECYSAIEPHPSPAFYYDSYLAALNAHIRPTRVQVVNVSKLYIPVLSNGPEFPEKNPFQIDGFTVDLPVSYALMNMLQRERRGGSCQRFHTSRLSGKEVLGKPSWLLDWHDISAYAWFHQGGNYSRDDLTVAFILGVPCSPHLGPSDADEWQYLDPQDVPPSTDLDDVDRVRPQISHGSPSVRVVETSDWVIPDSVRAAVLSSAPDARAEKRQKTGDDLEDVTEQNDPDDETGALTPPNSVKRFRVVDYVYCSEAITNSRSYADTCRLNALLKIIKPNGV